MLFSAALVGCSAAGPAATGVETAAIIDGAACAGGGWWESALALLVEDERGTGADARVERRVVCSAVLVAPDLALSAAHCVHPELLEADPGDLTSVSYWVSADPDLSGWSEAAPLPADATSVVAFETHPGFDPDASVDLADLALLKLSAPRGQPVAAIVTGAPLAPGVQVYGVGWGVSILPPLIGQPPPESIGVRRCGSTALHDVGPTELQVGWCATRKCYGDSGGPSFARFDLPEERYALVSVSSRDDESGGCARGGIETRVDAHEGWLTESAARQAGASLRFESDAGATPTFAPPEAGSCVDSSPEIRTVPLPPPEGGCASAPPLPAIALLLLGARWRRRARSCSPRPRGSPVGSIWTASG